MALDGLSKNTLIDLVVDRVRAEIGEDASEDRVAEQIQEWLGPVAMARGDKPVSIAGRLRTWDKAAADHVARYGDPDGEVIR
jgi:hypothetical protein